LAPVAANASAQQRSVLDGGWAIAAEAVAAQPPAAAAFRPARVPGTFEADLGPSFDGVAWYRRQLELDRPPAGSAVRVEFRAAATDATVFVNGRPVGSHLGGWTPFVVEIGDALRYDGQDLLEVRLDEKVGHNTQGFLPVIQPHFGGLWQEVVLRVDTGPVLDRDGLLAFGDFAAGELLVEAPVVWGRVDVPTALRVRVLDDATEVAAASFDIEDEDAPRLRVAVPAVRGWAPGRPWLYPVSFELMERGTGRVLDRVVRRVGFRTVRADGTTIRWNGQPLQPRGMLHWGVSPPHFAPAPGAAAWRRQLEAIRSLGCNLVKCCLFVPPTEFYELADELGLLVWQEYPTWHPRLTPEFLPELLREYDEFYAHDRSHVSVAFRSLTCETGHGASEAVLRRLHERAHARIPQAMVVDDSAWIGWHRVHDFYDDHPYGNNDDWPRRLAGFREHIAARRPLPLLLGECIAADTWFDLARWDRSAGDAERWWAPLCLDAQREFEAWVRREFDDDTCDSLRPVSLRYAWQSRKYQVERLRLDIPDAGYVLSVMRDFPKARMGFFDDFDEGKWSPADWEWHRDTMICLDTPADRRAFVAGRSRLDARVAHFGNGPLAGELELWIDGQPGRMRQPIRVLPGTVSGPVSIEVELDAGDRPARHRLRARLAGTHPAANAWDLYALPRAGPPAAGNRVRVVRHLDRELLAQLRAGARVVLLAGPQERSLKTHDIWFLRGAPFAPPHPVHRSVPAPFLIDLQAFDLCEPRVMHHEGLMDQVDPILAFWDTHDIAAVNRWLFAFSCGIGEGRLLATALDHESDAGRFVLDRFVEHLAEGPPPRRSLRDDTVAALAALLVAETIELRDWELSTDPDDTGLARGLERGDRGEGWRPVRAGQHWESQGFAHYDGVAFYRITVRVPEHWRGRPVHAVFEGVDDSYRLYVDGVERGRFGDPATGDTVWLRRTAAEIGGSLRHGGESRIVLRVVDHQGAGGLHRPAFLTTGPIGTGSDLLN
jgi:hypothetical protein